MHHHFYAITGGPASGKTTLLEGLEQQGYPFVEEVARRIIKDQVANRGLALPWADKQAYADRMWQESIDAYSLAEIDYADQACFFDRGILDTIAYMIMEDLQFPRNYIKVLNSITYKKVFILPPWIEIFEQDSERKQSWQEAVITYNALKEFYIQHGYTPIEVPTGTVEDRIDFILEAL